MFVTISLLLAAACLLPAAGKLTGQPKMRKSAAHFGIPWPRYRLIGVAELAAAAGILIGLWWHPLGLAAAAGMALLLSAPSSPTGRQPIAPRRWRPPGWPSSSPWPTWPSPSRAEQPADKARLKEKAMSAETIEPAAADADAAPWTCCSPTRRSAC